MFVVDSIRRLCLNEANKRAERAIGEIAAAWNEQMHIPHVELIFDFTDQLEAIGDITVSSVRPKFKSTSAMLIDIIQRSKNHHTIVVTSDRDLTVHVNNSFVLYLIITIDLFLNFS